MQIMKITFPDVNLKSRDTPKLRGAIASRFPGYTLLHNHLEADKFLYKYPKVQYKIIDGLAIVIGFKEGIEVLENIYGSLNGIKFESPEHQKSYSEIYITKSDHPFGYSEIPIKYKFITPWMALNQKNHKQFLSNSENENKKLLSAIMIGNILSLAKSMGYSIKNILYVKHLLHRKHVNFKNNTIITFEGSFSVNFYIPNYLGLGKSVSRGFGTVREIEHDKQSE